MAASIGVSYVVPWHDSASIKGQPVDMILSQAVLEHVGDLPYTYRQLSRWLKPGGFMSHQIDFRCHRTARQWNGHWAYSDRVWRLIGSVWPYLINREPYSTHRELLDTAGLDVVCEVKLRRPSGIRRERLASRFRHLSDDDLITSGAFVQAVKRE
jgi:hypothetical protein